MTYRKRQLTKEDRLSITEQFNYLVAKKEEIKEARRELIYDRIELLERLCENYSANEGIIPDWLSWELDKQREKLAT